MEIEAREIQSQFEEISDTGFALPTSSLVRKAVASTKKGKLNFSAEQLTRVVAMIFENRPYILFPPQSETKGNVVVVFWADDQDESKCGIQQRMRTIKQEGAVDNFFLQTIVENLHDPRRHLYYLLHNYVLLKVKDDTNAKSQTVGRLREKSERSKIQESQKTKARLVKHPKLA